MKNLEINSMGVQEMSTNEMKETDGGFIWLVVAAAVILITAESCNNNSITVVFGTDNTVNQKGGGTMSADSTLNNNTISPTLMPATSK